ncbi:MAG: hypothetical protein GY754_31380 [bacterium]|nr:hypothetical protein [bacterium]
MKRIAVISPDATDEMMGALKKIDIEAVPVPVTGCVAEPISGHPDLQVFVYGDKIFCWPNISREFLKKVEPFGEIVLCESLLSDSYPLDIFYNIACTGSAAFHRFDYCDPMIRTFLESKNISLINVSQGYSKCSTVVVDSGRIITADHSIHKGALAHGVSSLLIEPGHVDLPGYAYGFIGGASGMLDEHVFFTGTFHHHPSFRRIMEFIEAAGKKVMLLSSEKIIDLGSILFL